jgi:hypothetical protein
MAAEISETEYSATLLAGAGLGKGPPVPWREGLLQHKVFPHHRQKRAGAPGFAGAVFRLEKAERRRRRQR